MGDAQFRFGILGAGNISRRFAREVAPIAEIYGIAARDGARAQAFAADYSVTKSFTGYEALLADPHVDAIYIGTPAPLHLAHSIMCLEAGKAVLCEKPFTINAEEARKIAATAQQTGVFCMEAMWMRFNPLIQQARDLIAKGALGEVKCMHAEFNTRQPQSKESRLMDPDKGGGGLLDLGVYGLSLAQFLFGNPDRIVAAGKMHDLGVDEVVSAILDYPGHLATVTASVSTTARNEACIMGSKARIELSGPFFNPSQMRLVKIGEAGPPPAKPSLKRRLVNAIPYATRLEQSSIVASLRGRGAQVTHLQSAGFRYQAEEVIRCLRAGAQESSIMPLQDSIAVMDMVDQIRAQIGFEGR